MCVYVCLYCLCAYLNVCVYFCVLRHVYIKIVLPSYFVIYLQIQYSLTDSLFTGWFYVFFVLWEKITAYAFGKKMRVINNKIIFGFVQKS